MSTIEKAERLFTPANIVMALLLALLSWGGSQLLEVKVVQARVLEMQLANTNTNEAVAEMVPRVHRLETKVDSVICMMQFSEEESSERVACITEILEE